jgi:hypothetical protein
MAWCSSGPSAAVSRSLADKPVVECLGGCQRVVIHLISLRVDTVRGIGYFRDRKRKTAARVAVFGLS